MSALEGNCSCKKDVLTVAGMCSGENHSIRG